MNLNYFFLLMYLQLLMANLSFIISNLVAFSKFYLRMKLLEHFKISKIHNFSQILIKFLKFTPINFQISINPKISLTFCLRKPNQFMNEKTYLTCLLVLWYITRNCCLQKGNRKKSINHKMRSLCWLLLHSVIIGFSVFFQIYIFSEK